MRAVKVLLAVMVILGICTSVSAEKASDAAPVKTPDANNTDAVRTVSSVTIAIIDFQSDAPGNDKLGSQVSDILTARLSIYDQFQLVERKKLEEVLNEHQINLSGMVDPQEAIKVGKMLGARIMIFGRAFAVDKDIYMVAKIVGTETSLVKGVMAKGRLEGSLSEVIDQLVEKIAEGLEKWSDKLLPKNEKFINRISILKEKLKNTKLPTVSIVIPESHINRQLVDPAAETEMKKVFKEVGFNIIEPRKLKPQGAKDDIDLSGVEIVITGEGFSEYAARFGGLVSCTARLEVQVTERDSHKIIASERTTKRAVDLSEAIASKTALQSAGHELAITIIEKIANKDQPKEKTN